MPSPNNSNGAVFECQLEKELYNAFALGKDAIDKYVVLLDGLMDKILLIDIIRGLGRKDSKGLKQPTPQQIKALYFKTLEERKPNTGAVRYGVYDAQIRKHLRNTTEVFPSNDLEKCCLTLDSNPNYFWESEEANNFIWACLDSLKKSQIFIMRRNEASNIYEESISYAEPF